MKEVEEAKKRVEEEKLAKREAIQLERAQKKKDTLQSLIDSAQQRDAAHTELNEGKTTSDQVNYTLVTRTRQ